MNTNTNMNTKPATLTLREDSHSISKPKPKIKIVHIFAPEIIKTDAANFRDLVQRLTGKPAKRNGVRKKATRQVIKGEAEEKEKGMWEDAGGYLNNFGDVEGFFQGFSTDFSMLPLSSSSSHMDHLIGEAQVI